MVNTVPSAVPTFLRLRLGGDHGQCQKCGLRSRSQDRRKRHPYAIISGSSLVVNAPSGLELVSALEWSTGEESDQARRRRRQSDGVKLQYPFLVNGRDLL